MNNSRIILLSGTPFDKQEQIPHFFRLISIMKHEELSEYDLMKGINLWLGFADIIRVSRSMSFELTAVNVYLPENSGTCKQIIPICFTLFQKIINDLLSHLF